MMLFDSLSGKSPNDVARSEEVKKILEDPEGPTKSESAVRDN